MKRIVRISAMVFVATLVSCGGGNKGGKETNEITYKLPESTKQVTQENESAVTEISKDQSEIVLDAKSNLGSSVKEGDVLLFGITSKTPRGLLRKVVSRQENGSSVALKTEQATLEDAFENLHLKMTRDLKPGELESTSTSLSGLTILEAPLNVGGTMSNEFQVNFDNTVLYDMDGSPDTTDDQVVADGSITFTLSFTFEVDISWFTLKHVKIGPDVDEKADVEISTTMPGLSFSKEIPIADLYFPPFTVGPVPVVTNLELVMGANGELTVQVSAGVNEEMGVSVGAMYEDSAWQPYADFTHEFGYTPPQLDASASLKAYLGPKLNLLICGVAGPYGQINGYMELTADINADPWWALYAGIEGWVGITGKILSFTLGSYETGDLIGYRKLLAQADGPIGCQPDCEGKECGDDGCGGSCGECGSGETCKSGQCVEITPTCGDGICDPGEDFDNCPSDCECQPDCEGKECGDDGCGGSCGECGSGETCVDGKCQTGGCNVSGPEPKVNCSGGMCVVPAGPFCMGCVDNQCGSDEYPYHEVDVPAFEIDKYEVTVSQYGACVNAGACTAPGTGSYCNWGKSGKEDHPVNCIDWNQAKAYCEWAGKRLCSESEWEKASRGTDGRIYPWGNEEPTCDYCVMDEGGYGCGTDSTWSVGSKPAGASPYGALDMSGNVWEWVEDDWHISYTGAPTNGTAWVDSPRASTRVVRGGSFHYDYAGFLRSSNRSDVVPVGAGADLGVRCCRSK